ncbi:TniB family NTP-binding protein [Moritella sp. 24]|uniref:TniB family NTP-binding protein n=1 Tax=Moritella sp. 24 TaxID=2746230 RepID=UPI001BA8508A|nr:TniB family NTP-binding protein [Moritella sp. 24]QUM76159.1 TniB family NTP-binding protein [Moritella sp. 24]
MLLNKQERIERAKKAFITTPDVAKILKNIERCRQLSRFDAEPSCMMVYGASGVGKSSIIRKYLKSNEGSSSLRGDIVPVFYIELPDNAKPVDVAREMLLQLNDPLALHETDVTILTKRIIDLVSLLKIEMIIIDEFQHLIEKISNRILARVGDWLKIIIKKTQCPIALFGMPYSQVIFATNSQLNGLFSIQFHLRPFSYAYNKDVFIGFLKRLDEALPFDNMSGLGEDRLAKKLYAFSGGNMRSLRNLVFHASVNAIESERESIITDDFRDASELTSGNKLASWENPFQKGVTITDNMLADPAKELGYEDYIQHNKRGGKPFDPSKAFN